MKKIITMEVILASQSAAEVIVLLLENQITSFIQKNPYDTIMEQK